MDTPALPSTEPIEQMVDRIGVNAVFGPPTTEGDVTVIPVAQLAYGFGYGGGYGSGANGAGDDVDEETDAEVKEAAEISEGGGGGVGAGGRVTPRGYIRIDSAGVTYQPIADETRIPLAALFMICWSIFWVTWTIRSLIKAVASRKESK